MNNLKRRMLYSVTGLSAIFYGLALAAQEAAKAPIGGEPAQESLLDLILLGGPIMIPLFLCSLVALTLLLEREINLRKNKVVPDTFWPGLKELIGGGKPDLSKGFEYCVNSRTPIGNILKIGIEKWRKGRKPDDVEKAIEDAASREVSQMARTLRGFKIVAGISPLLGLLGTVYGMIKTFQMVAHATATPGTDKAAKLAAGIYEAMVTTAAGLTIAIPVLLIYYYLNRRVDNYADNIEEVCTEFMDEYQEANK